jgi:hypothetical protein
LIQRKSAPLLTSLCKRSVNPLFFVICHKGIAHRKPKADDD